MSKGRWKTNKQLHAQERRKFSKRAEALAKMRNEMREELSRRQVLLIARITEIYFASRKPEAHGTEQPTKDESYGTPLMMDGKEASIHSYIFNAIMRGDTEQIREFMDINGIEIVYEVNDSGLQSRKMTWKQGGKAVVSLIQGDTISFRDGRQQREFRFYVKEEATGNEYPVIFENTNLQTPN